MRRENRRKKPVVFIVGDMPGGVIAELVQLTREEIERVQLDEIGALPSDARVLLVGAGLELANLQAIIVAVRERLPSLVVIAINCMTEEVQAGLSTVVDWSYKLPEDSGQLQRRMVEATNAGRAKLLSAHFVQSAYVTLTLLGVVAIWHLAAQMEAVPEYILPDPQHVWNAFVLRLSSFLGHMGITAGEAFAGFVLGNSLGIATGILLHRYGWLRGLSLPWLTGIQAIPIVALAPLLSVWLGTGFLSKVVMAAIVCYFPIVLNVLSAFSAVDRDLARLFVFHRAGFTSTLAALLLPASYPALLSALRISGGLAVVGAIVAEFTGSDRGLGYLLLNSTYRLEIDRLFVAIILSALLGFLFASLPNLSYLTKFGRKYPWGIVK